MLKKLKQAVHLNRTKLSWLAISMLISCWMVYEQAKGSPLQFVAALLLGLTMLPAAMTDWERLPSRQDS